MERDSRCAHALLPVHMQIGKISDQELLLRFITDHFRVWRRVADTERMERDNTRRLGARRVGYIGKESGDSEHMWIKWSTKVK